MDSYGLQYVLYAVSCVPLLAINEMRIDLGSLDIRMSKHARYGIDIDSLAYKKRRMRMPEAVERDMLSYSGILDPVLERSNCHGLPEVMEYRAVRMSFRSAELQGVLTHEDRHFPPALYHLLADARLPVRSRRDILPLEVDDIAQSQSGIDREHGRSLEYVILARSLIQFLDLRFRKKFSAAICLTIDRIQIVIQVLLKVTIPESLPKYVPEVREVLRCRSG